MTPPTLSLPSLLSAAFSRADFQGAVMDALDWVPELKHENLVCTHLSSALRKMGVRSAREITESGRRFDMKIENVPLEAKYHLEGDIHGILNSFEPNNGYIFDHKGWNSPAKGMHQELNRTGPSWFLWMICVRDMESTEDFIYPRMREKFVKKTEAKNFEGAVRSAEEIMCNEVVTAFRSRSEVLDFALKTIQGRHSALVTRLFYLSSK